MITVEIIFSLYFDENNEFSKTKRVFCSVFPSGSHETDLRVKRLSWVILAIFGHFCKIKKRAHWRHFMNGYGKYLNSSINSKKIIPMPKNYSRFPFDGNHATYKFKGNSKFGLGLVTN